MGLLFQLIREPTCESFQGYSLWPWQIQVCDGSISVFGLGTRRNVMHLLQFFFRWDYPIWPYLCLIEETLTSRLHVWFEGLGVRIQNHFRSVRQPSNGPTRKPLQHLLLPVLPNLRASPPTSTPPTMVAPGPNVARPGCWRPPALVSMACGRHWPRSYAHTTNVYPLRNCCLPRLAAPQPRPHLP